MSVTTQAEPLIQLRDVGFTYPAPNIFTALTDVDLVIDQGESVAISGASGSGKSTLLALLGMLDLPSEGSYRFLGKDVNEIRERERLHLRASRIGFVFQSYHLLAGRTVLDNVAVSMRYRTYSEQERHDRAAEVLELVGLAGRAHHLPDELSGGERQRAAIARALAPEPMLILADEPTGNLDSQTGTAVLELLASLNVERGVTLVIVTHDPGVAARQGRRIITHDGRVSESAEAGVAG